MHYPKLDAYFHVAAHGNKEAYQKLYAEFKKRAETCIQVTVSQMANFIGNPVDFTDLIDILFFKVINEYDIKRGTFSNYVDYIFSHRLVFKVQEILISYANQIADVDRMLDDSKAIEALSDPNQRTIPDEIAIKDFKARISSPNKNKKFVERITDKVMTLQYMGFTNKEIRQLLKLTNSQLRTHIERIRNDKKVVNFKLEMK